jgi:hypothetical protein
VAAIARRAKSCLTTELPFIKTATGSCVQTEDTCCTHAKAGDEGLVNPILSKSIQQCTAQEYTPSMQRHVG